jgi:hypothetical protein
MISVIARRRFATSFSTVEGRVSMRLAVVRSIVLSITYGRPAPIGMSMMPAAAQQCVGDKRSKSHDNCETSHD